MERSRFIKLLSLLPLSGLAMNLQGLYQTGRDFPETDTMPVLFLGHGSPMNAIEQNEFSRTWNELGKRLPRPSAILCISAHWETRGTFITAMEKPRTIHDFGGFPQVLFDVQYPAPGNPQLAEEIRSIIHHTQAGLDNQWGLDHGTWSVIKHMYPDADIPVLQLSMDYTQNPQFHYTLARDLSALRKKGVLIIGSGNIVHNLGKIAWDKMNTPDFGFDWALEANEMIKKYIIAHDFMPLAGYKNLGASMQLAVPSPDHFLPLLYVLGLIGNKDEISFFNDKPVLGSLTMTSLISHAG